MKPGLSNASKILYLELLAADDDSLADSYVPSNVRTLAWAVEC
jgi:hypothetical protein